MQAQRCSTHPRVFRRFSVSRGSIVGMTTGIPPGPSSIFWTPPPPLLLLGFSRGLEEAAGHPTHRLPQQPHGRAPMPRCWGPEHRAHTTPHTHQPRPTGERQRCAPALNTPPPADPSARGHTGTAASPSHQRLGGVRGSSAVWTAVRPDNQRGVPSRDGEVRAHWPWVTTFGASRDLTQPNPTPPAAVFIPSLTQIWRCPC